MVFVLLYYHFIFCLSFFLPLSVFSSIEKRLERIEMKLDRTITREEFKMFVEMTNKRFEEIIQMTNARFEDVNRRFEEIIQTTNARFEDVNRRFEELHSFLSIIFLVLGLVQGVAIAVISLFGMRILRRIENVEKILLEERDRKLEDIIDDVSKRVEEKLAKRLREELISEIEKRTKQITQQK